MIKDFIPITEATVGGRQYKAFYTVERNPHGVCDNNKDGTYTCRGCGETAPLKDLESISCTKVSPPCKHCGLTPICAGDCPGVGMALGDPTVHLAGFDEGNPQ